MRKVVRIPAGDITNLQYNFVVVKPLVLMIIIIALGIGDRHMGNYLICLKSGNIIPIDFGYSFGISVTHLRIPELVQLRLTPQIRTLLGLNLNGLYR